MSPHDDSPDTVFHRLRDFRLFLPNPTFRNPPWGESGLRALIVRLSPFSDVERSTPHLFLARELRRAIPDAFIDMAFLPEAQDLRLLEESGLPPLIGTQSHRFLSNFDVAFVSNSHLLELVNLPFLLSRSKVPLWADERGPEAPPILLGGSNSAAAHAIVSETGDCMADALFFGEGEGAAGRIAELWLLHPLLPKRERLTLIAREIPGMWVAGDLSRRVAKAVAPAEALRNQGAPAPVLPGAESRKARIAITLGCPCLCSFCFEGHDRKPFREVPADALLSAARELKAGTGADTLEIVSFNFNTHSALPGLLAAFHRLFLRVNLMSQRADILARTPGLLDLEIAADKRTFTLGIEGISARLRRFLHKSLETADIEGVLKAIHARRTREIKLFYLLTGREGGEDFSEFAGFLRWLKELRRGARGAPRLLFSFGLLVRMPFTPLRHDPPLLEQKSWRPLIGRAKSLCETNGIEFRLADSWPRYAATQILAREAPGTHTVLERLAEKGSVAAEGLSPDALGVLEEWIAERGPAPAGEELLDNAFAFPFLDNGATATSLRQQFEKARRGQDEGYCRKGAEEEGACARCTGCTRIPGKRPARAGIRDPSLAQGLSEIESIMREKRRLRPLRLKALIPLEAAGLGQEWLDAWLTRRLMELHPGNVENVLSVRETLFGPWDLFGAETAWFGETVVEVAAWNTEDVAGSLARGAPGPFGEPVDVGEPGVFSRLSLRLHLPAGLFPDPVGRLALFLRDRHAPVTVMRAGGGWRLAVAEKSTKKGMILGGSGAEEANEVCVDLVVGPKFPLGEFLASFPEREAARRALVEVTAVS